MTCEVSPDNRNLEVVLKKNYLEENLLSLCGVLIMKKTIRWIIESLWFLYQVLTLQMY